MPAESPQPGTTDAAARLEGVHKRFGRLKVLKGISLSFPRGKVSVVLGPSGCGKSVMLKHLIGLLQPDKGEVWYGNTRVDTMRESKLSSIRRECGFLFQQGALFDSMSVGDNVAFPLIEHTPLSAELRRRRVLEILDMVGLQSTVDKMPGDLSGGQRKRVALARAIVLEPRLMLYDEPTTGLDPIRADVINELILKLQRKLQMTSIVVTHDLTSAFRVADRMIMLYDGHVVLEGEPETFRQSPDPVVQRFLRGEATADELAGIHEPGRDAENPREAPV